jgi:hypothetical protein
VKAVDHRDEAESGIEIKNSCAPVAIYDMPLDLDALYRWEKSGENGTNRRCALNWRPDRSHKLDVFVKWRSTDIPRSKAIQVRFNGTNYLIPHGKTSILEAVTAGAQSCKGQPTAILHRCRLLMTKIINPRRGFSAVASCIVGYSEVVRSALVPLLLQVPESKIAVFRTDCETTDDHHLLCSCAE